MHVHHVFRPEKQTGTPPAASRAAAVFGPSAGALAPLAGARVLIVDDDDDARELVCALLGLAGATVWSVGSVAQALSSVPSFDPDVVLTDFAMPDANGLDLIRELRLVPSPGAVAVPILMLSGHGGDDWRARAFEAGAADVLTKPFDPAVLIARVAAAVPDGRNNPPALASAPIDLPPRN